MSSEYFEIKQSLMVIEIGAWISSQSGKPVDECKDSEILEMALASYCCSLGATSITKEDIANIAKNASWTPCAPEILRDHICLKYDSLSIEQVSEMAAILNERKDSILNKKGTDVTMMDDNGVPFLIMPLSFLFSLDLFQPQK